MHASVRDLILLRYKDALIVLRGYSGPPVTDSEKIVKLKTRCTRITCADRCPRSGSNNCAPSLPTKINTLRLHADETKQLIGIPVRHGVGQ